MNAPISFPKLTVRDADLYDDNDCARITAFVEAHPGGTPFHLPQWSIAVERGCGQRARMLVAQDAQGALHGILPLTETRSPLFGNAMVSAGFAVGGGVLASDDAAVTPLVDAAWALTQNRGCNTLELRGGARPAAGWQCDDSYLGFVGDLAQSDEEQLSAIPRKQRAEIRKSLKGDLTVETGRDARQRRDHYAVYAESVRNLGTPVFPKRLFTAMLEEFGESADILVVREKQRPVAAVLSLYWRGTVYPYWGGGVHAARTLRANERMYYALMCHARRRGCARFDFGRSKVGTGPAAYKKNWGFTPEPLTYWARARDGEPRKINPLSPKYRLQVAAWKKLPLWAANRIGPLIAKGLG
ncbi:FemAB family PEP-CTERM system-associated protein [Stakelama sp. CBK3Z-3]|uniref:FemAB family PEP-CTERM system-associated protein n=1 Tax=Stakelama flava TaxID=2860338 RepID=A0ABS6XI10_9SPHN|nr:FemAB family XrtA/PEP-CTERM system-associated protein [Stakelama flava]MBW4329524.1 FemAB family PEP-CTERM system-associated protein [Stakelama flava]